MLHAHGAVFEPGEVWSNSRWKRRMQVSLTSALCSHATDQKWQKKCRGIVDGSDLWLTCEVCRGGLLNQVLLFQGGTGQKWVDIDEDRGHCGRVCVWGLLPPLSPLQTLNLVFLSYTERQLGLPEARPPLFSPAINSVWLIWVRLPRETLRLCPPLPNPSPLLGFCPLSGPWCSESHIPPDRW